MSDLRSLLNNGAKNLDMANKAIKYIGTEVKLNLLLQNTTEGREARALAFAQQKVTGGVNLKEAYDNFMITVNAEAAEIEASERLRASRFAVSDEKLQKQIDARVKSNVALLKAAVKMVKSEILSSELFDQFRSEESTETKEEGAEAQAA